VVATGMLPDAARHVMAGGPVMSGLRSHLEDYLALRRGLGFTGLRVSELTALIASAYRSM
jgi:hypothetical protein